MQGEMGVGDPDLTVCCTMLEKVSQQPLKGTEKGGGRVSTRGSQRRHGLGRVAEHSDEEKVMAMREPGV